MEYLVIDGYNVINQRNDSFDLKIAGEISYKPPIKNNTIMSKVEPDIFEKLDKIRKGK